MIQFAILLISLWTSSSYSASFDCIKARSNIEKAICNDTELSQLDEKLDAEYKVSRLKLSPSSVNVLVASQRSWLKFIATYCFIDSNAAPLSNTEVKSCLSRAFKDRINDLLKTGDRAGGFKTFIAIDHNIRVLKENQSVYALERKFIQVDDDSPTASILNSYLGFKEKANLPNERGTESYDIQLSQISPDWLYKQEFIEVFTGAYPTNNKACGLFSLKLGRPLEIADIFHGSAWQQVFETMIKKHFLDLAKNNQDFDITMVSDFQPRVTQPTSSFSYCLNKKGIELDGFLPHVIRAYDGVLIEWSLLSNLLTPYALNQVKKMGGF